jgi:hypothetical protein
VCASTPQQGDQVDASHDAMMLARPMAVDQVDLLRVGFVERGIVPNKQTRCPVDQRWRFLPQRGGIGVMAMEQARQGVMGGAAGAGGWQRAASVQETTRGAATRKLM